MIRFDNSEYFLSDHFTIFKLSFITPFFVILLSKQTLYQIYSMAVHDPCNQIEIVKLKSRGLANR